MTSEQPLVSIIIPTFNRAVLIGETLDSVLAQTYKNWECIIVDDGSTDNTAEVVQGYLGDPRFQYHHRPADRPKGANACRNYGFELSKGEFVNWFDDDDVMLVDFIKRKVENFENQTIIVISTGYIVNENFEKLKLLQLVEPSSLYKDFILWNSQIITDSVMFRKDYLINKDLFSYKIKRGQETELFSRLFFEVSSPQYKLINTPLFLYRQHSDTKTARNKTYRSSYKKSQAIIWNENFKRSFQLEDAELVYFFYKILVKLFFNAIKHNDKETSFLALQSIYKNLFASNKFLSFLWFIIGHFLILFGYYHKRVETYFKAKKIKIK